MALQPTDLFAVRRGTTTYKAPFSQIQDYITDQMKATWLPSHLDDPSGIGVSTWNGPADTLTATPDIEVSIAGGAYGTGGAVGSPSQIQIRWIASAVTAAAHAAVLTGRLENAAGNVAVDYSTTIDKLPAAITINAKTDVAASAAVDSDSSSAVAGLNAPARLWLDSTDGTLPMVSIAGNAWVAVPTTAATGLAITQGQTFKLRHTTQAGASTVTTTTVRVGWDAASSVTAAFATTNVATKAPVIGTVTLADSPEAGRFTSGTFATTVTMTEDGAPASTKGLKAWVEGALKQAAMSSAITAVTTTPAATTYDVAGETGTGTKLGTGPSTTYASSTVLATNVPIGTAPSGTPARTWSFYDLKAPHAVTIGRTADDVDSIGVLYGTNDPAGAWTLVAVGTPGLKRQVTGSGYRYYAYSFMYGTVYDPNQTAGSHTTTAHFATGSASGATLTLTDTTGLADFAAGDAVTEVGNGNDATGTVGSVDVTAKTITLSASAGTWDVGSQVKGPLKTVVKQPNSDVITAVTGTGSLGTNGNPGSITWKNAATASVTAKEEAYGKPAQDANNNANHPVFQWAAGLTIDGHNDWYLPAKDELEIVYFNLKPSTDANKTTVGANRHAVPPTGNYTTSSPAQTTSIPFRAGNAEAFAVGPSYGTATEDNTGTNYCRQSFDNGSQDVTTKTTNLHARVIRRVPYTGSEPAIGSPYEGGYFAGLISTSGTGTADYALILAPNKTGTYGYTGGTDADPYVLAFATDKELADFASGDAVTQGGPAVPSVNYGSFVTSNTNNHGDPNRGFDGNLATDVNQLGTAPFKLWFRPVPGIPYTTSVEVHSRDGANAMNVKVNGGTPVPIVGNTFHWTTVATGPGTLNEIEWDGDGGPNFTAIRIDGQILISNATAGSGTVASTDPTAKTMTLATSSGLWSANTNNYVIGPAKPASNVKLYTVHDAAGAVSDLQSADPGYVTMTGNSPYTLTFPATLPSGNPPDTDLPAGTTITTDVQATSTGSTPVNKASNTVTPA